jgi:hypothetical protein
MEKKLVSREELKKFIKENKMTTAKDLGWYHLTAKLVLAHRFHCYKYVLHGIVLHKRLI